MVACVRHVPGRARLKLAALRRDADLAERIRREVAALPGVFDVEIDRHATSVIVHHCAERCELARIMDQICVHCPNAQASGLAAQAAEASAPKAPLRISPAMTGAMRDAIGKAVLNTFIKSTVERGFSSLTGLR